ncbi:ATP-dependent protease, putative [Syntrophotalea carbinolica DSM 2380]|uniref:endopeptidase La n=1 Tax=Syntrophotalea carbinolica (strain DSM 2380 / NBRC 103641 / GraBd1) TaxID=338963 RepID=Q3A5T7_SYNC1|nr:ATP-binding protein [Syntrophotalea carbinolica]ABA88270.1 ATP-dependent protease, putative [Syntrophotalea carbinolica DSM 2380]
MEQFKLSPQELFWKCDAAQFEFSSTDELRFLEETIGQERALTAIEFGLSIDSNGFNIFVLGESGTGRSSTIKRVLERRCKDEPVPDDWCYVHDFKNADRPNCVRLAAGLGKTFQGDMETLISHLAEAIPRLFESKEYEQAKNSITQESQEKNKKLVQELEAKVNAEGFLLQRTVGGLVLVPTRDGQPLSQQEYGELDEKEQQELEEKGGRLQEMLNDTLRQIVELEKRLRISLHEMEKNFLNTALQHLFEDLEEKYKDHARVLEHLGNCRADLLNRADEFRPSQGPQVALGGMRTGRQEPSFDQYRVNLLVDNGALEGAPVVYEPNPTYFNLFGRIEHIIQMGNATTNFTMIKSGALHRANGGYLIVDCREVLINLFSYEAIKRCLRHGEIKIEDMAEQYRLIATVSLKPEPIPLKCKLVMIGLPMFYYLLYQLDPDFRKYFKVKSDFNSIMKNTWENVQHYALFIATQCRKEGMLHFSPEGVASVVEYAARLAEDKNRLSCRFMDLSDLIREASFYAVRNRAEKVERSHVELAVESKEYRSNKLEQLVQEFIEDGRILVDTAGEVVGQINGLAVYLMGDYSFGKPSRITVRTFMGKGGVINIEREAKLSGPVYDKGVLILSGFIGDRYAQDKPLTLAASICFEQSYSGVEGDSASAAELFGLLSSLAGLPLRQGIAVTGSVNQRGQLQPIGGVNEKIEGFYAVCKAKGFTGQQGVLIPDQNRQNLMLKQEVVDAVEAGQFHVWAVRHIDEGLEILTGIPAGQQLEDGTWPEGTVNYRVNARLEDMVKGLQKFARPEEKNSQS